MAADEAVIEADVYQIGGDVGHHGDAGLADGPHGGAETEVPVTAGEAQGDDFEIIRSQA